jgi:hypothetical protein
MKELLNIAQITGSVAIFIDLAVCTEELLHLRHDYLLCSRPGRWIVDFKGFGVHLKLQMS